MACTICHRGAKTTQELCPGCTNRYHLACLVKYPSYDCPCGRRITAWALSTKPPFSHPARTPLVNGTSMLFDASLTLSVVLSFLFVALLVMCASTDTERATCSFMPRDGWSFTTLFRWLLLSWLATGGATLGMAVATQCHCDRYVH